MTTIPAITAFPTPAPSRSQDPDVYIAAMNAWLAAMVAAPAEFNAFKDAANSLGAEVVAAAAAAAGDAASAAAAALTAVADTSYMGTSSTSLSIPTPTASRTFTTQSGKSWSTSDRLVAYSRSNPDARMYGSVTSYSSTSLQLSVDAVGSVAGTFADWVIVPEGFIAMLEATVAQVRAGTADRVAVTPASLMGAMGFVVLTDGATINWDTAGGFNRYVTLGGARTLAAPTNLIDGETYALAIVQDGTGSRTLSWNSIFDWGQNGAPTLSTTAGKVDFAYGQYCSVTSKIHMNFRKAA